MDNYSCPISKFGFENRHIEAALPAPTTDPLHYGRVFKAAPLHRYSEGCAKVSIHVARAVYLVFALTIRWKGHETSNLR